VSAAIISPPTPPAIDVILRTATLVLGSDDSPQSEGSILEAAAQPAEHARLTTASEYDDG